MENKIDHGFNVCRLCLASKGDAHLKTLFDDDWSLTKKYFSICGIELSHDLDDGIPALICNFCLKDLNKTSCPQELRAMERKAKFLEKVHFEPRREALQRLKEKEPTQVKAPSIKQEKRMNSYASKMKTSIGGERGEKIIPVTRQQASTICATCHKIFVSCLNRKRHEMRVHLKVKNFFCNDCQFSCFEKAKFKSHLLRYHAGPTNQHRKHPEVREHKKKSKTCILCNKTFFDRRSHNRHVKQVHVRAKNYFCDMCSFSSYLKEKIGAHMINNHMIIKFNERKFKCEVAACSSAFKLKNGLSRHLRFVHKISKSK